MRRISIFQLILTFFGLTYKNVVEFRLSIFNQIHEIVFHGKGGYDYFTIYNMPIWLRNYTFNKIKDWYSESNKQQNKEETWVKGKVKEQAKNTTISTPSYVTKASKK